MWFNYFSFLSMSLMLVTSGLAIAFHPTHKIADEGAVVNLESMIPKSFGEWRAPELATASIINPLTKENLAKIYTQTLSRSYVNNRGDTVMLSIAYGADQSDAKSLHYPEVCYPAQGFQVITNQPEVIKTNLGNIRVKRLLTVMGSRTEPITYWTTIGNKVVYSGLETKLEQLHYGFKGQIPDGLLFRVSTIDNDEREGFEIQTAFISDILNAMTDTNRLKFAGLNNAAN